MCETYGELGHAFVDDVHCVKTDKAVDGRKLEQREFDELRRCYKGTRFDDQEYDAAVAVAAFLAHDGLSASRDIPSRRSEIFSERK